MAPYKRVLCFAHTVCVSYRANARIERLFDFGFSLVFLVFLLLFSNLFCLSGFVLSFLLYFFFIYPDVHRFLKSPCPTPCLLQVLHFSEIAANTKGGATKDPVSHTALDLEGGHISKRVIG